MSDKEPLVTIGIPFFNPGEVFRNAVKSVFSQTYTNWELLLVDDGSTDGSLEIARSIRDSRVRVISDGRNLGLPTRLNQINQLAVGKYIARMDADDLMHPDRIARQVRFLRENPDIDVVGTGVFFLDERGIPKGVGSYSLPANLREALMRPWLVHASIVAKKEWFLRNPYNPDYTRGEERELFFRAFSRTRFGLLPEPLYGWRFVGVRNLSKYLASFRYERKMLLEHGPHMLGWAETGMLLARSLMKSTVAIALYTMGVKNIAYRRVVRPIPDELRGQLMEVVKRIEAQEVPGW